MRAKDDTLSMIFQETEQFIRKTDPKRCSPPYIMNTFSAIREKAYEKFIKESKNDKSEAKVRLGMFIDKFEIEYIEILRDKLKERYAEYIQQKRDDVPSGIDFRELKSIGATDEISQLARSIAEWSLELEILSYTIEGLRLYGLKEIKGNNQKQDYIKSLKQSYTYKKEAGFSSFSEYLLRRMVNFTLGKVSSLALVRGVTKVQFGTQAIFQIFMTFSLTNQIPWRMIVGYMNLPWLLGGFACSLLIKSIQDYARRDEVISNLQQALTVFEDNKLHLMSERSSLLDLALKIISSPDDESYQYEMKKLSVAVDGLLNPTEASAQTLMDEDIEKMFEVKEMEDYFLVEEKDHKEQKDDSGVLVIDW